jgi:hypothetical protein
VSKNKKKRKKEEGRWERETKIHSLSSSSSTPPLYGRGTNERTDGGRTASPHESAGPEKNKGGERKELCGDRQNILPLPLREIKNCCSM